MSATGRIKSDYAVDIVFCVDLTAGANEMLQQFKNNCVAIIEGINETIEQIKGLISIVRTRVIGFKDLLMMKQ